MMNISIKRIITHLGALSIGVFLIFGISHAKPIQGLEIPDVTTTLTQDSSKVIDTSSIKDNPISAGSNAAVGKTSIKGKITGLVDVSTTNYGTILNGTLTKIQNLVNRSLGLLAVICVIYLVYNGVILLIKFDDDKAQGEALNSIKTVAWVIGGIGLTWFIISAAFYVVSLFGGNTIGSGPQRYGSGPGGGGYSLEDDLNKKPPKY